MPEQKILSPTEQTELLNLLKQRFHQNMNRHIGLKWEDIREKLESAPEKIWSIQQMEKTDGEPDLIGYNEKTGEYLICDCSAESPSGRRNVCYDQKALEARKKNKPETSALEMARNMNIELLTEQDYLKLQQLGEFDQKTSSWLKTPNEIRKLGGALFGDRRYGRAFIYHNGASSYYGVRGFRGLPRV